MTKALFCWSGGKDSAMALYLIQQQRDYEIVALVTTVTESYDRISMHGVRVELLEEQAARIGLPLEKVIISQRSSNAEYEAKMKKLLVRYKAQGVTHVIFGDIFLEDLKIWREKNLAIVGMHGVFPVWNRETEELSRSFITAGFKTIITCIDTEKLDGSFAGRLYDESFLNDLPATVDPCGENGEFHSFVYDGPVFNGPVAIEKGETVFRDNRFMYCDIMPVNLNTLSGSID